MQTISKSKFKPRALEIMREVERTGKAMVITDHGEPVLELRRYHPDRTREDPMVYLKGSVLQYSDPIEPVAEDDWDAAQ